jgi:RNA polymerase sigma factor for flagellar operon FliA
MEESSRHAEAPSVREQALWHRYVSERDPLVRGQIIERYLGIAQKMAAYLFSRRRDNSIDFADYLQYARVGLIEAIDRFNPDLNVSFATFASYRIRGAILNGIRRYTEQSSQKAYRQAVMRERTESLRERTPEHDAGAVFEELVDTTIGLALGYILEDSALWNAEQADRASDPYQSLELKRLQQRVGLIVEALPDRERMIIRYHYYEYMEFTMVAEILGVTKGRVSQIHARALRLIREAFESLERFQVSG